MYPLSDSTSSDINKVLFNPGIVSLNEDFQAIENNRETEEVIRFNSLAKVNGIASETRVNNDIRLFPSPVTGSQISINKGTGFTRNGARITIASDLSILDITALTNYTAPTANNKVYLVLRKVVEQYQSRAHPISGVQNKTRQRLTTDNSIVEFIVGDVNDRENILDVETDVIVLGRLSSVGPIVFDTTEKTGGRKILRTTENKALEVIGGILEGDLDFDNHYNSLNYPQWGKQYYNLNGSPHNRDFVRLFARLNYTLATLRGIKFNSVNGIWGITFEDSNSVKMSLIPNERPPIKINVTSNGSFFSIPENNVVYLQLTDTQVLLTSGNQALEINLDSDEGGNRETYFVIRNFLNSNNLGNTIGKNLLRFPIAYHFKDSITNIRKLVFANGQILSENEEIDSDGKYSGYVRRDGGNIMIGDLIIQKNSSQLILRRLENPSSTQASGIIWQSFNGVDLCGKFVRLDFIDNSDNPEDVVGDTILYCATNNGTNAKVFRFKVDGRLSVPSAPVETNDVVRLLELTEVQTLLKGEIHDLELRKYDKTGGLISGPVEISGITQLDNILVIKENIAEPNILPNYSQFYIKNNIVNNTSYGSRLYMKTVDYGNPNSVALINSAESTFLNSDVTTPATAIDGTNAVHIMTMSVPQELIHEKSTLMINCIIKASVTSGFTYIRGQLMNPSNQVIQYWYITSPVTGTSMVNFTKIVSFKYGHFPLYGNYKLQLSSVIYTGTPTITIRGGLIGTEGVETQMSYVVLS